jgi:signal peptidase I
MTSDPDEPARGAGAFGVPEQAEAADPTSRQLDGQTDGMAAGAAEPGYGTTPRAGVDSSNGFGGVAETASSETAPSDTVDSDAGDGQPDDEVAEPAAAKPHGVGYWLALPFVKVYRFCFPKKPRPFLLELPFLLVIALLLAFVIKTFFIQAFVIPSGSMQNTLAINDRVVVNRLATWFGSEPKRGEVVVFQDPGGWLQTPPAQSKNIFTKALTFIGVLPEDNGDLIKRVIGIPGDKVACCDPEGRITVNGVPLTEPYIYPGDQPGDAPTLSGGGVKHFQVTVRPGNVWVMGDHRSVSEDSRMHMDINGGQVPESKIVGRAVAIVWPFSQMGTLPVPSTFHQNFSQKAVATAESVPPAAYGLLLVTPAGLLRRRRRRRLRRLATAADGAPSAAEVIDATASNGSPGAD